MWTRKQTAEIAQGLNTQTKTTDKATLTVHKFNCNRVFKHYDKNCPRCQELIAGQAPRDGWQKEYYAKRERDEAQRTQAIKEHFAADGPHAKGLCGPVCTAFDW